jgi:hypothetical protein
VISHWTPCSCLQMHAQLQTMKAMALYMSHVMRKAWKGIVLFYWRSVAERHERKLQHLENLRYRADAGKSRLALRSPVGFKQTGSDSDSGAKKHQQGHQHGHQQEKGHEQLLTIDLISSDEDDDSDGIDSVDNDGIVTQLINVMSRHVFIL